MTAPLEESVKKAAREITAPNGAAFQGLDLAAVGEIAGRTGASRREVEIAALNSGVVPLRYQRNLGTVGTGGQVKLLESRVVVVGSGGLGGLIVELLARMGVGRIAVADGEVFTEDNLNRQVLSSERAVGKGKTAEAARRVGEINSAVEVQQHPHKLDAGNAPGILRGADVVVDALDSIPARLMLQKSARDAGVPLVSSAIAGFIGYVTTIMPGDPGWEALYPSGPVPEAGVERELGNPAATPAVAAALEVQEVVKVITGRGEPLRGGFLFFDTEGNTYLRTRT